MRVQQTPVTCLKCQHWWRAELPVECAIQVWAAAVKTLRCPKCGAGPRKIGFGRSNVPEPAPCLDDISDQERRHRWLDLGDNGISSETIAAVMCGAPFDHRRHGHPHDGDDFGRCHRLLCLYPQWRERLDLMRGVSPAWDALVSRWTEIEAAYKADLANREGRACWTLMREILEPVERATACASHPP
jgi:hypothetical protein